MAWIELHQQLPTHPKTKRLTRALGLEVPKDIPRAVGHLVMFWLWCIDYATEGDLGRMSAQDIADAAGWTDDPEIFVNAMRQAEFIDTIDGRDVVHDWGDYIGRLLESREKERQRNREKQRRYRERQRQQSSAAAPVEPEPETGLDIPADWLKVVRCYETNIGLMPYGASNDMLYSFYEDLGADVVCLAIEVTNKASANNPWKYLTAILNKWAENGIKTREKAEAYIKDLERRLSESKRRRNPDDAGGPPAVRGNFY